MEEERIVTPGLENGEEERLEKSLRPSNLEEYIGQDKVKENMKIYIESAKKIMKKHGIEKFLFGSDFPMWDHLDEMKRFERLELSGENRDLVLYKNAENLLESLN